MPPRRRKLKSWIVRVRETVIREYVVEAETEDDARSNPHTGKDRPVEIDLVDWEVEKVEENR